MKYDLVLSPNPKKSWIHYDIEIHNKGGSVEIKRKTIQKIEGYYDMYANNKMKFKEFKDIFYYNLIGIIDQNS